jgi:membrane protease YdiL (CAAX protease family)
MDKITNWIRRHQVLAFFGFTYAITWPLLLIYYYLFAGNPSIGALMEPFVVFSPALMAMLISGIAEPRRKHKDNKPRWIAFILAWLISATILIVYAWKIYEVELIVAVVVYSLMAFFPAWVLSSAYACTPGIRKQFSTLLKPRGPAIWYLVIFLIFPGFQLLDMGITKLMGGEIQFNLADLGLQGALFFLVLEFLKGFLFTGGINEESGWRGFALPRLQARYPVIVAGAIVWFFWAFWHLPYDIGRGIPIEEMLKNRLFWNLVVSILMTWLYNRTDGSILAPALFHPAMNTFGNNLPGTWISRGLLIALTVFAILYDRMWRKLPSIHQAVYHEPEMNNINQNVLEKTMEVSHV